MEGGVWQGAETYAQIKSVSCQVKRVIADFQLYFHLRVLGEERRQGRADIAPAKAQGGIDPDQPLGVARLLLTNCSSSLIWVRIRAAWEKYSSPSDVRLIDRVVRLTRRYAEPCFQGGQAFALLPVASRPALGPWLPGCLCWPAGRKRQIQGLVHS